MRAVFKKISFVLMVGMLLSILSPSTTHASASGELKLAYQQGEAVEQLTLAPEDIVDLRFLGAPDNWSDLHPQWFSSDKTVAEVDSSGVVTAKALGETIILLVLDNGMTGLALVSVAETPVDEPDNSPSVAPEKEPKPVLPEKPEISDMKPTEETENKYVTVLLLNQDAIHIPEGTTFSDGTPIQNIYDITRYAFSFMLEDGTPVMIPDYAGNTTGITDIAGIDYRPIKGASSVIIKSVYLKVYFDVDQDGWVSAAEKAEDAIGYYCIEVDVDKTLSVEDWSIVK